ncbi:DUF2075 domain-containing protein [Roseibium alexandrii]|uniref:Schlafen group 3-like DNA/RNA helicase domain-containing protein n=1 Tax=Roseibium alexandrii (strain DSM 17067 / NCIMB 14079 / DFL-11) TaxID=244592 RepID=A0A5E8GUP0_ROSAD|nr:DUF2075 domain-containing protein [Roseibium alexandrii]EEE43065.2 hypothetical protein SADFL11_351 [Roseibium alexandrii DFL-11]
MFKRSYFDNSIPAFILQSEDEILGALTSAHQFELTAQQRNAWIAQIVNLKQQLAKCLSGHVYFEFTIPRMGKRVDVVLLIQNTVFVIEYKTGEHLSDRSHDRHAIDQVVDYALDLKNFHEGSHSKRIVPILVTTGAPAAVVNVQWDADQIARPLLSNGDNIEEIIRLVVEGESISDTDARDWSESGYKPTPTIIEAAQALYQGHAVEEISRSDAGVKNLSNTTECILDIITNSRKNGRKSICFVTGVPGAGKTLAGLNISTRKVEGTEEHAVFLSGNGPLVTVMREALARDRVARAKANGNPINKKAALQKVSAFIQNIHHFRDEGLRSDNPPVEHVVVFDEAQRAWNQAHAERFMVQKRGALSFDMSEPEFLISLMDRREDWCTIVCLIGGGQEINTGEAGLTEWFDALAKRFQHWDVYHSGHLNQRTYSWGQDLNAKLRNLRAKKEEALHLAVSVRSYRAEKLSDFVEAIIDGDAERARHLYLALEKYPLAITRDLSRAKNWLRNHARGTERIGLVASSGAIRLKPEGLQVKSEIDPANWFLNNRDDIRSSFYLEDVATEFDIQGLELDWTCMCWDADYRREADEWRHYSFKGTKWQHVKDAFRKVYLANAYRVLLTRARQGMVILIPRGDEADHTRYPHFYEEIFEFLLRCGITEITP